MPIYEYACDACGHEFEETQNIRAEPVAVCPKCRKRSVRRLISRTSFVLKGSGWYVTDYARSGSSGAAHRESDSDAKPADSKPADVKPGDSKPGDSKPEGAKPREAKPRDADAKPAAGGSRTESRSSVPVTT